MLFKFSTEKDDAGMYKATATYSEKRFEGWALEKIALRKFVGLPLIAKQSGRPALFEPVLSN